LKGLTVRTMHMLLLLRISSVESMKNL